MGTATGFDKIFALLCVFLLYGTLSSVQAERHSLYYIYTALSKPVDLPGIYKFSAMGLLDDIQIDYYNSEEKRKIPKQQWMKEKIEEDYWEKGTLSRKSKEQWFHLSLNILMNRMRHNESDLHVLQRRVGCEIQQQGDEFKFSRGIYEFSYDGEDFLSFDIKESQWVAPVDAALLTKRKWDSIHILNQYTKDYLEKECVDWLNKYREYGDEKLRNGSSPDVHMFAKKSISDKTMLKLTCMATDFYPKDVSMTIRKYRTSLPEDEIESTGIRPNHDGSFQLRKSVEIKEDEKAEYDCFVSHKSIKKPVIIKWDGKCQDCRPETVSGLIGGLLVLVVVALVVFILKKKRIIGRERPMGIGALYIGTAAFHSISAYHGRKCAGETANSSETDFQEDFIPLIPAENMVSVPEQLLQILDDLDSDNIKMFKWFLKQYGPVPASLLENADNIDVVDQMVNIFGRNGALKLTVDILKMMKQNHLAEQLEIQTRRKVWLQRPIISLS